MGRVESPPYIFRVIIPSAVETLRKSLYVAMALWVLSLGFVVLSDDFGTDDGYDFTLDLAVVVVAAIMLATLARVLDRRHAAHVSCLVVQADPRSPPRV